MNGRGWGVLFAESARLAVGAIRVQPLRSTLAVAGVVIGVVTVTLVTSVLAGARGQIALLFREFGSDNIFAYHRSGDPYTPPPRPRRSGACSTRPMPSRSPGWASTCATWR